MIQCSKCSSGEPHLHQPSTVGCQGCADLQAEVQRLNLQVDAMRHVVLAAQKLIHAERWPYLLGGGFLANAIYAYEEKQTEKPKSGDLERSCVCVYPASGGAGGQCLKCGGITQ